MKHIPSEKFSVPQPINTFSALYGSITFITKDKRAANFPLIEPDKSSAQLPILFRYDLLIDG